MSENPLDSENWKLEAQAVIDDIKNHVKNVEVSETLPSTDAYIYFNLETIEGKFFCVQLSAQGFAIVGYNFDQVANEALDKYYETPYALLNQISPKFKDSFANELLKKLENLSDT